MRKMGENRRGGGYGTLSQNLFFWVFFILYCIKKTDRKIGHATFVQPNCNFWLHKSCKKLHTSQSLYIKYLGFVLSGLMSSASSFVIGSSSYLKYLNENSVWISVSFLSNGYVSSILIHFTKTTLVNMFMK